jgi:hypothetical protein
MPIIATFFALPRFNPNVVILIVGRAIAGLLCTVVMRRSQMCSRAATPNQRIFPPVVVQMTHSFRYRL